jgi:hypothetical protein
VEKDNVALTQTYHTCHDVRGAHTWAPIAGIDRPQPWPYACGAHRDHPPSADMAFRRTEEWHGLTGGGLGLGTPESILSNEVGQRDLPRIWMRIRVRSQRVTLGYDTANDLRMSRRTTPYYEKRAHNP